ncbi:MAG TPA: hypothetical protein VGQ04_18410 [Chitinophagaceae bacterium]|jgi:hypothetical protein|nr:hypothetical protein [Chitinophagaceae bacterium]
MEVHAHSHLASGETHTERKKWTHYFWEFLMLFLAVFCGFLAENQREHYIEKKRAKEYAVSLLMDLKVDTFIINNIIKNRTFREQRLSTLMDELEKKLADQQDTVLFDIGMTELARRSYPILRTGTYEQVKNSGSLRYFANRIATALVEYESDRTLLEKQLEIENKYVLENIILLREKFCNPKYLRYATEEKTVIVTDPLISKDPDIQLQVYRSINFLRERNQIYIKYLNEAADVANAILLELETEYHLK